MRNPLLLALLAVFVVLVSGCTATQPVGGVVIEKFEPDLPTVFPGEQVSFHVKVRNTGSVSAEGGKVEVLGLEDWELGAQPPACELNDLLASAPETAVPGETYLCPPLDFKAPDVPQGLSVTYDPMARVYYTYASSTHKQLTFGTREVLKRIQETGGPIPAESSSGSRSPVLITVNTNGPIRVSDRSVFFPLEITVANVGGGVVCLDKYQNCGSSDNWNKVRIDVKISGNPIHECSRTISLTQGSNTIVCQADVSDIPEKGIIQKTVNIESIYGYFSDEKAKVIVEWNPTT